MGQYTKEEIKIFEDKELRIVRQAILKKLIEKCKLEDVYGVSKVTELSEKYVDYVYSKRGQIGCVVDNTGQKDWEQLAKGLNLAIPNSQNVKILNQVLDAIMLSYADKYNKATKASANPCVDILVHILDTFGKYPVKTESVEKVVKSLTENFER